MPLERSRSEIPKTVSRKPDQTAFLKQKRTREIASNKKDFEDPDSKGPDTKRFRQSPSISETQSLLRPGTQSIRSLMRNSDNGLPLPPHVSDDGESSDDGEAKQPIRKTSSGQGSSGAGQGGGDKAKEYQDLLKMGIERLQATGKNLRPAAEAGADKNVLNQTAEPMTAKDAEDAAWYGNPVGARAVHREERMLDREADTMNQFNADEAEKKE